MIFVVLPPGEMVPGRSPECRAGLGTELIPFLFQISFSNIMFYTYILYSHKFNKFYIGQTKDVDRRFLLHNNGNVQSTAPYRPWTLVGSFQKRTRSESMTLERKLKNLNREDLLRFIHRYLPGTIINFTKP